MLYKMAKDSRSITFIEVEYDVEALCIGLLETLEDAQKLLVLFRLGIVRLYDDAEAHQVDERRDTISALIDYAKRTIYASEEEHNADLPTLQ